MKRACVAVMVGALLLSLAAHRASAADKPLSRDEVQLLLLGGATESRMLALIGERGVDFQMTPEIEKQFRDSGATSPVIEALEKAAAKLAGQPAASSLAPSGHNPNSTSPAPSSPPAQAPSLSEPSPSRASQTASEYPTPASQQIASGSSPAALAAATPAPVAPAPRPVAVAESSHPASSAARAPKPGNSRPALADPSPAEIQHIIQAFAAKEELFRQARDAYTYHQINKVETLDADNQPTGEFEQDWDILYDDNGKRIERVTYAPLDTLKDISITEQDLDSLRHLQPFVLTTDDLPKYEVQYLGHVVLDQLTAYVFRVRPKEIEKGEDYFQGVVWVDDRDLQIVKSEGKAVFDERLKEVKGQIFPRFTTWRQQIDGKFWFPTFTMADDTLYFPGQPVRVREIVKYTDYKQFKSTVKSKVIEVLPNGQTQELPKPPPKDKKP